MSGGTSNQMLEIFVGAIHSPIFHKQWSDETLQAARESRVPLLLTWGPREISTYPYLMKVLVAGGKYVLLAVKVKSSVNNFSPWKVNRNQNLWR